MTTVDLSAGAATAEKVVNEIGQFEPMIASMIGMFVPGAGPIIGLIQPFAPIILGFVARALDDIAKNNGGDLPAAVIELLQHISKGQPNSPALTAAPSASTQGAA